MTMGSFGYSCGRFIYNMVSFTITSTTRVLVGTTIVLYVVLPFALYCFPVVHKSFLFMNFLKWPWNDYHDLSGNGIAFTGRNFYLNSENDLKLGLWQILPQKLHQTFTANDDLRTGSSYEQFLLEPAPIILYLHGNGFTRSAPHRVELLNLLAAMDFHVLTLDYRGFGDSEGDPTELGVVHDAMTVFRWIKKVSPKNPVFIWGHSLGTAIGTRTTADLCKAGLCPVGLILEAPFNNLTEAVRSVPITRPFKVLPWFDWLMVNPLRNYHEIDMNSDQSIQHVQCPILILHAKDDQIIPFELGQRLHEAAKLHRRDVEFVHFESHLGYGHKNICRAPELSDIVKRFSNYCLSKSS